MSIIVWGFGVGRSDLSSLKPKLIPTPHRYVLEGREPYAEGLGFRVSVGFRVWCLGVRV